MVSQASISWASQNLAPRNTQRTKLDSRGCQKSRIRRRKLAVARMRVYLESNECETHFLTMSSPSHPSSVLQELWRYGGVLKRLHQESYNHPLCYNVTVSIFPLSLYKLYITTIRAVSLLGGTSALRISC